MNQRTQGTPTSRVRGRGAPSLDAALSQLERRRRVQRALRVLGAPLGVGLATAAVAVLLVRLAVPAGAPLLPILVGAGLLAPVLVSLRGLQARDARSHLAAHLDELSGGRGLVMTLALQPPAERPADWLPRAEACLADWSLPEFQLGELRAPGAALLCLIVALLLPQAEPQAPKAAPRVATFFEPTREALEEAAEAEVIPEDDASALAERLAALEKQAERSGMDAALWEALDRADAELRETRRESMQKLAQALTQTEAAKTLDTEQADALARATEALQRTLEDLEKRAPGLKPEGAEALRALTAKPEARDGRGKESGAQQGQGEASKRRFDPSAAKALAEQLAAELQERYEQLSPKDAQACDNARSSMSASQQAAAFNGVSQGEESSAPLTFTERRRTDGGFGDELSGQPPDSDEDSRLIERARAPETADAAFAATRRGALRAFDPTAADARSTVVAPRHRSAVGRYFDAEAPETRSP